MFASLSTILVELMTFCSPIRLQSPTDFALATTLDLHPRAYWLTTDALPDCVLKRKTDSRKSRTGFLSYEGLEPSTHALKGRCSTN